MEMGSAAVLDSDWGSGMELGTVTVMDSDWGSGVELGMVTVTDSEARPDWAMVWGSGSELVWGSVSGWVMVWALEWA